MRRWMFWAASLLLCSEAAFLYAEDKVTVEAKSENISDGLDLKAVANLFGEVKNLEEFEQKLNSDSLHLCNLDLNGDGRVDYLRVVETVEDSSRHNVLIQAVLANDIYQDIATIMVEKTDKNEMLVKLAGDAKIFGKDYVVEPVYIYRPVIYDWFWSPNWVCYYSPWSWGYWPGWYVSYPCWVSTRYWNHVYVYHYDHPRCSYNTHAPRVTATQMRNYSSRPEMTYTHYVNTTPTRTSSSRGSSSYSSYSSNSGYSGSRGVSVSNSSSVSSSSRGSSSYSGSNSRGSNTSRYSSYSSNSGNSGYSSSRGSSVSSSSGSSRGSSSYSGGSRR